MQISQFSQLLDEIQRGAPEPVTYRSRAIRHDPRLPSRSVAIPKAAAQMSSANLFKALDSQLSNMEANQRTLGPQIEKAATAERAANVRARAAALIERTNGEMLKAIAAGELGAQETAERQILLDAFARRMGLS